MQPSWRSLVLCQPVWRVVAAVAALSVALSVGALVGLTLAFGLGFGADFGLYVGIAVAIPLVVSAPVSWLVVGRMHDAEAARQATQELAWHDMLTGLLNRRRFVELAAREMHLAQRSGQPLAAAVIDLDHFKQINDRHGHAAGDAMLRAAAHAIQAHLRESDLLGRWGGEEFAVVMPSTRRAEALAGLERVREALQALRIEFDGCVELGCTASIGVAVLRPQGDRLEDVLGRADEALYAAKAAGRDRVAASPWPDTASHWVSTGT